MCLVIYERLVLDTPADIDISAAAGAEYKASISSLTSRMTLSSRFLLNPSLNCC